MGYTGALTGIRVLDFTWAWAGPHCTRLLADLGADVIKVESASRPDMLRRSGPWPEGVPGGTNRGGNFNQVNRGKRSIAINLKKPEGRLLALSLASKVDVMVSNFAGGVMERLGLDYRATAAANSRLVWAAISGFGLTGPQSADVTFGPPMTMYSGLASITGYEGDLTPRLLGSTYCDAVAGNHAAIAIVAALIEREITGRGQQIDVSMLESTICMIPEMVVEYTTLGQIMKPSNGAADPSAFPQACYRCRGEDAWVAVSITSDQMWDQLCSAIERRDLMALTPVGRRREAAEQVHAALRTWACRFSAKQAAEILNRFGVAAAVANSAADMVHDPHLSARGFWAAPDQPDVGRRIIAGPAFQMTATPPRVTGPAPQLGEDTEEVLAQLLGASPARIRDLKEGGVLE